MLCPNKNLDEWKNLVGKVGENKAHRIWNKEDATLSELFIVKDSPEKSDLQQLADKTKLFLQKKLAILEKKEIPNKKIKEAELNKVIENIKALDDVSAINAFIEESYSAIKQAEHQFDKLISNKDNLSRHETIEKLASFNDFANGYSILDEISKADIESYFSKSEKGLSEQGSFSIQDKLTYAISAREKIKQRYLKHGIPLLASYLLESKSENLNKDVIAKIVANENKILEIENDPSIRDKAKAIRIKKLEDENDKLQEYNLDEKTLIKQLQLAARDEGALDFLFSPLISSDDSVIALFAKSIKNTLEDARQKDIKFAEKVQEEFNNFLKTNGKSRDKVSEFNSDIYEEIEVPTGRRTEEGKMIFEKQKAFVQKYDVTKFEKDKDEFFNKLGEKPTDPEELKKWNQRMGLWFRENTKPKDQSEIDKIVKNKKEELLKGLITKDEYDKWESSVMYTYNNQTTYKGELTEPANKYINKNWDKLYDVNGEPKNDAGRYHKFLTDSYFKAQEKLPEHFRRGYILPSIPKDDLERVQTNGLISTVKTKFKEATSIQAYDTEYGITGIDKSEAKFLPVNYTGKMSADAVSTDLVSSIMQFNSMVNRYDALNNINAEISLMKSVIGQRETIETNTKGQKLMDAFASKLGYKEFIRQNGESYSAKHIDAFIDMIVYGEMQKAEEIGGYSAGKITDTLLGYSAITTLAVDMLKATANNIQGNIQVMIEANSGQFFNKKNLMNASGFYIKSTPDMLKDFGKISPDSLASKLIDSYDAIQGEFKDTYGKNISGSVARKLFRTDTLFFNQNLAEHEIQVKTLFAILDAQTVIDNETKEPISLLEAYKKYGINEIESKTDFTESQRKDVMNKLHALNKRLHGVYNEFDKATIQRYSLGRLLMMYRKYLIPSYKRRWKSLSADQEAGVLTEGYYITFNKTFIRDLRDLKFNIAKNWENYTDFEKAQIKRTLAEASFIISLTALTMVLKAAGDDDKDLKKNYLYNFVLYQAVRQRSETFAYLSPVDAYRVVKSPSAMTTSLDRTIKFADQLFLTWDPDKLNYTKKTGVFDKGTNKSYAYFLKLLGLSGYNMNPAEAVKAFEGTLNK